MKSTVAPSPGLAGQWVLAPSGQWVRATSVRREVRTDPDRLGALTDVWAFRLADGSVFVSPPDENVTSWSGPGNPDDIPDIPGWDEYFLGIAMAVSARGKCRRRQVGAVLVDEHRHVISLGYNGAPSGMADCIDGACPRGMLTYEQIGAGLPYDDPTSPGFCIALHAEANALASAGVRPRGATCYVTDAPCPGCTKALAGAGVTRVVWPNGEGSPVQMMQVRTIHTQTPTVAAGQSRVVTLTRDQALAERARILDEHGPEEDLRARAAAWELDAVERAAFDRIEGLDFLLRG